MTDHARQAAEKLKTISPWIDGSLRSPRCIEAATAIIQEASGSSTALLRQQNSVLLEAMAALRKRCDRYEREPLALNQFMLDDGWTQAEIDAAVKKIRETGTRS